MSDSSERRDLAAAYDHSHPGLSAAAAAWLTGPEPLNVLELGAGTGTITAELVRLGHRVYASDSDPTLLGILSDRLPDVPVRVAEGPRIEAGDKIFDLVVAPISARFDLAAALPEIARVLIPEGHLTLVRLERDTRIPWVRRLCALIAEEPVPDAAEILAGSQHFGWLDESTHKLWQAVDRSALQDQALAANPDAEDPSVLLAEVARFYDDYGRGHDGMQLPWTATCIRAQVTQQPVSAPSTSEQPSERPDADGSEAERSEPDQDTASPEEAPDDEPTAAARDSFDTLRTDTVEIARVPGATFTIGGSSAGDDGASGPESTASYDNGDTEMLLIDFR